MENKTILIKNGLILTMEDIEPVIENGNILIKNGLIDSIIGNDDIVGKNSGPTLKSIGTAANGGDLMGNYCAQCHVSADICADVIIDASGCIVMPGLVNCHTHLPMSLFRGLADDLPLDRWLNDYIFPAEAEKINPESVKKWALLSCHELLLSGTTTCCDGYFYEKFVAEAVIQSGLRAVLGQGIVDFPAPGVPDPLKNVEIASDFIKGHMLEKYPGIYPSVFCHSPYTCSEKTIKSAKLVADSLDVIFQIHVGETRNEKNIIMGNKGLSPVGYLDSIGVLDTNTLLVHCVWVDKEDIAIIKKRGASVVYCAESNMKLASGIAPVAEFLKASVPVGLGTDGSASNNNLDLFTEMDIASKLQKVSMSDPCVFRAQEVVKMATIGGARAIGLDKSIGSLNAGKKADIVIIDTDKPHLVPMHNPFSTLVYSVKGSDVRDVIVDGKIIVLNGKIRQTIS